MSVGDDHDVAALLDAQLHGSGRPLDDYLAAHSNLPGPMANFAVIRAAVATLLAAARAGDGRVWQLLDEWALVPATEVPANDPREILPATAALAHGSIGAALPDYWQPALARLRRQADDERWRTRELVAQGLQAMARADFAATYAALTSWVAEGDLLAMRAAAAALAEPDLMAQADQARAALALHAAIIDRLSAAPADVRRSPAFRALRQGLGYTLSVVAVGAPAEALPLLRACASSADADVRWLLRENLKKRRLRQLADRHPGYKALLA